MQGNSSYILKQAKRLNIINLFGGKCSKCGESDTACMSLHHLDAATKDINVSRLYDDRFSKIIKEANKCILLCQNCHRSLHTSSVIGSRQKHKLKLLNDLNTHCCEKCGYSANEIILVFHHIDPSSKKFTISNEIMYSKNHSEHLMEAKKCMVLCPNCHSKIHFDYNKYSENFDKILLKSQNIKETQSKIDENAVLELKEKGLTNIEIAREMHSAKSTISGIFKKRGLSKNINDIKLSTNEINSIEELYIKQVKIEEIAHILHRNRRTIIKYIKTFKNKYEKRKLGSKYSNKLSEQYISKEELQEYVIKGLSHRAIAKIFKCDHHVISRKIKEYSLK